MSLDQIIDKYRHCAGSIISKDKIEESIREILDLEKLSDMGQLIALIVTGQ